MNKKCLVLSLFVLAVVAFPFQAAIRELKSEPYPGFYQPAFGSSPSKNNEVSTKQPLVDVTYADSSTRSFNHREIMADAQVLNLSAFNSAFSDEPSKPDKKATVRWLRDRVQELDGGKRAVSADIEWREINYDMSGDNPASTDVPVTTHVKFA